MRTSADGHGSSITRQHLIDRPRLDLLLLGRFEYRLTTMVAPGGSGKTSALALAIENNRLDPRGVDVVVPLSPADDSDVALLGSILARADDLGDAEEERAALLERLIDFVWTSAPLDVAIILDDVHVLESSDAIAALAELVERLPANGHVLLSSRRDAPIRIARLRAHRAVLEIDQHDLGFDDDELEELRLTRSGSGSSSGSAFGSRSHAIELPRHAATADLRLAAGADASTDFLREEVLASLGTDRLEQLRRVSVFDDVDDELVGDMTDGRFDADTLLASLPLVEWRHDGTIRLHSLLREALAADWNPTERRKAASVGADLLAARHRHAAAIRLHLTAHDEIAAREVARTFISSPGMNHSMQSLREVTGLIETIDADGPLVEILRASRRFPGQIPASVAPMLAVAEHARTHGDPELESLALHRACQAQMYDLDIDGVRGPALDRLEQLAEDTAFASGALAHVRSQLAQSFGDADGALAALDEYGGLGEENRLVTISQRLCDLGRVEEVGDGLTPEDLARLPEGSEVFIAFAMWLRGEESPEFAHEFVTALLVTIERRGLADTLVSTLGVATSIALAAGDVSEAQRRADWAADLAGDGAPRTAQLFADVAQASVAAMALGDDAAAEILERSDRKVAAGRWPFRAHLLALPLVYVTRPGARPVLDSIRLGPALTIAVRAGQAIVALRAGDPRPARDLPWSQRNILRVHVLPHHLVELACAAAGSGSELAGELLADVPDVDRHLARLAGEPATPAGAHAASVLGRRRRTAPHTLHVDLLGPMRMHRDGLVVTDDDWSKRTRVRELMAVLCARRHLSRIDTIAEIWPDHADDDKADANLRATLSRLQGVLEPGRTTGDPYFLRTEGDVLILSGDVTTDVAAFERTLDHARQADAAGSPARALALYLEALELYRGEYALGVESGWVVLPRVRLRTLATSAMCRAGELTAARGEPEEAARWAQRAQREDPLDERAAAIFIGALGASGDRAGVRQAVDSIEAALVNAGVGPSPTLQRVFERWR